MNVSEQDFRFMVNSLAAELIEMIVEDRGVDYLTAAEILYRSELYEKLENPSTRLYFQSAGYVYSYLQ
ncbi:MAG: hypothetical protein HUK01_10620 [Bacteroidaceae bacterium]|nr:hypothetical protein [Bacteroidaceae bacterium]